MEKNIPETDIKQLFTSLWKNLWIKLLLSGFSIVILTTLFPYEDEIYYMIVGFLAINIIFYIDLLIKQIDKMNFIQKLIVLCFIPTLYILTLYYLYLRYEQGSGFGGSDFKLAIIMLISSVTIQLMLWRTLKQVLKDKK